jgi:hypothetical protein
MYNPPKIRETMTKFFINGNTVNWANFNVEALNIKNGAIVATTTIPEHLRLKVCFAGEYDPLFPDVVSDASSSFAMRHGKRRHFLLLNGGKVVGWATFHRKERDYKVTLDVTTTATEEYTVKAKSEEEAYRKAVDTANTAERDGEVIDWQLTDVEAL